MVDGERFTINTKGGNKKANNRLLKNCRCWTARSTGKKKAKLVEGGVRYPGCAVRSIRSHRPPRSRKKLEALGGCTPHRGPNIKEESGRKGGENTMSGWAQIHSSNSKSQYAWGEKTRGAALEGGKNINNQQGGKKKVYHTRAWRRTRAIKVDYHFNATTSTPKNSLE